MLTSILQIVELSFRKAFETNSRLVNVHNSFFDHTLSLTQIKLIILGWHADTEISACTRTQETQYVWNCQLTVLRTCILTVHVWYLITPSSMRVASKTSCAWKKSCRSRWHAARTASCSISKLREMFPIAMAVLGQQSMHKTVILFLRHDWII